MGRIKEIDRTSGRQRKLAQMPKLLGMKTNNRSLFEMNNFRCQRKIINGGLFEMTLTF